MNDGARLERVADTVRDARDSGSSAIALARLAKEMLGEACSPIAFRYVLQTGLGIGFRAAQEASLWSGLEDGPHAISDEALEAVLAPWISTEQ